MRGARLVVVRACGEDLGYVPLEAFLSGKAVLTTEDAGGPLEFVRDGLNGLVVPPRPEAIGAALEIAWENADGSVADGGEGAAARRVALDWDLEDRRAAGCGCRNARLP